MHWSNEKLQTVLQGLDAWCVLGAESVTITDNLSTLSFFFLCPICIIALQHSAATYQVRCYILSKYAL